MTTDDANPTPPTKSRLRWWIHLILIGGYFAATIPLAAFEKPNRSALLSSTRGLLLMAGIGMAVFLVVFMIACLFSRPSREDLLLTWRPGWWVIPLGIGYSLAIRFAAGILLAATILFLTASHLIPKDTLSALSERPPIEKVISPTAMENSRTYYWFTITVISFVVAGFREELWRAGTLAGMRALWPNQFQGRNGGIAAVALIAIVFGLAHLTLGLIMAAMAGILGFFLGIIMIFHRSIWPAVIAHGMFDATTFALLPWLVHFRPLP